MLVHYLRKKVDENTGNWIKENKNGRYLVSKGPLWGVLVSNGYNQVGWSLWNQKAEDDELRKRMTEIWIDNGMPEHRAFQKAQKLHATFDKGDALKIALNRCKSHYNPYYVPSSIQEYYFVMKERSRKYYGKEKVQAW